MLLLQQIKIERTIFKDDFIDFSILENTDIRIRRIVYDDRAKGIADKLIQSIVPIVLIPRGSVILIRNSKGHFYTRTLVTYGAVCSTAGGLRYMYLVIAACFGESFAAQERLSRSRAASTVKTQIT